MTLGVQAAGNAAATVDWTAHSPPGVTVSPSSGQLALAATKPGSRTARATVPLTVSGTAGEQLPSPFRHRVWRCRRSYYAIAGG